MAAKSGAECGSPTLTLQPRACPAGQCPHPIMTILPIHLPTSHKALPHAKRWFYNGIGRLRSSLFTCEHINANSPSVSRSCLNPRHQAQLPYFWLWACNTAGSIVLFIISKDILRKSIKYWARSLLSIWCATRVQTKLEVSGLIWLLVVWKLT